MHLQQHRAAKLSFLSVMYLAQGLPWGFVSVALTGYMYEQGLGAKEVGAVLAMAMLPWPFKWVLGPILDRWTILSMGRRRPWIILAQGCMIISTLTILSVPGITTEIRLLGIVLMLHNCFVAMQDVAVDALAVDILHGAEREKANALMFASSHIGTFIGSAGLGAIIGVFNFHAGLWTLAILQICIFLVPLLMRERAGEKLMPWTRGAAASAVSASDNHNIKQLIGRVWRAFSLRTTRLGVALALTGMIGMMMTSLIAQRYIIQDIQPQVFSIAADAELISALEAGEVPAVLRDQLASATGENTFANAARIHPQPGTELAVPGEGTWKVDASKGALVFSPAEDFSADPSPVLFTSAEQHAPASLAIVFTSHNVAAQTTGDARIAQGQLTAPRWFSSQSVPKQTSVTVVGDAAAASLRISGLARQSTEPGAWVIRGATLIRANSPAEWQIMLGTSRFIIKAAGDHLSGHRGWTQAGYSAYAGTTVITAVIAALLGGFIGSRIGVLKVAAAGTFCLGLTWIGFAFALTPESRDLTVVLFMHVDQFFTGIFTVALWAMFMQISWPLVAATQFTAYMAMLNVSRIIGSKFAGASEGFMSHSPWALSASQSLGIGAVPLLLLVAGTIQISVIAVLYFIDPGQTRRVLGDSPAEDHAAPPPPANTPATTAATG
jgi:MFS family permease